MLQCRLHWTHIGEVNELGFVEETEVVEIGDIHSVEVEVRPRPAITYPATPLKLLMVDEELVAERDGEWIVKVPLVVARELVANAPEMNNERTSKPRLLRCSTMMKIRNGQKIDSQYTSSRDQTESKTRAQRNSNPTRRSERAPKIDPEPPWRRRRHGKETVELATVLQPAKQPKTVIVTQDPGGIRPRASSWALLCHTTTRNNWLRRTGIANIRVTSCSASFN